MNGDSAAQRSLAAAVRQFLNQAGRLLEEQEPRALVADNGPLQAALAGWRQAVDAQTSGLSIEKARSLEADKLTLMGEVGSLKKECADLRERNEQLRAEVVRLNQREQEFRQQLLDAEFRGGGARAQAKTLDLEIRDLRRRIRELEGGPPLSPSEAAPRSMEKLQALFGGPKPAPSVADALQATADNAGSDPRPSGEPGEDPARPAAGPGDLRPAPHRPRAKRAAAKKKRAAAPQAKAVARPRKAPASKTSKTSKKIKRTKKDPSGSAAKPRRAPVVAPAHKAGRAKPAGSARRAIPAKPGARRRSPGKSKEKHVK